MTPGLLADPDVAIIATGALVGIAAALVGPFLILRGQSLLTDAISHAILLGIVVVWMLTGATSGPVQILGAALTGLLTVWLTEVLARTGRVKDDAAIGLVFPALFALGVLLVNIYARDVHIDAHAVLLGEIGFVWLDLVTVAGVEVPRALLWMGAAAAVNAVFVTVLWKELKLATFDPVLAHALGFAPRLLFHALLFLTSATAVAAFDAVGAVMFIAFAIVPPSAAYLLTDRLSGMIWIGAVVALVSALAGYPLALVLDVSIGGSMACMTGVCLALAVLFGPRHGVLAGLRRRAEARDRNAGRALVVHLHTHETDDDRREERLREALSTHLGWSPERAEQVLDQSLAAGLVVAEGDLLTLTDAGRDEARALLEPWARGR